MAQNKNFPHAFFRAAPAGLLTRPDPEVCVCGYRRDNQIHDVQDRNYVTDEYQRNVDSRTLYTTLLKHAFGSDAVVVISHHILVKLADETVHEMPSADTVLFDHDIMGRVFGTKARTYMASLAVTLPGAREARVRGWLEEARRGTRR